MFDKFVSWLNDHNILTPHQLLMKFWIRFFNDHSKYDVCDQLSRMTYSIFLFVLLFFVLFISLIKVSYMYYSLSL